MEDKKNIALYIVETLLLAAIIIVAVLAVLKWKDTRESTAGEQGTESQAAAESGTDDSAVEKWQEGDVSYNGKKYRYNSSIKTYLFLGTDNEGTMAESTGGLVGGQSDAMFLLVTDAKAETMSIISINRNTMTMVDVYDLLDKCVDQQEMQICLQYAYGDGGRTSCLRAADAVSRLFYNIPISGYFSMNMDAVPILNDAVGGVTIEVMDDLENESLGVSLKKGETVTLDGKEAYVYIRSRDVNEFDSASRRLERQNQYLLQLFKRIKGLALDNEAAVARISSLIEDYLVTSIDFAKLAEDAAEYAFDESRMYNVPGETVMGETYEEYYVDEEALYEMILEIFYNEVP